jgi:hypothetical protein
MPETRELLDRVYVTVCERFASFRDDEKTA